MYPSAAQPRYDLLVRNPNFHHDIDRNPVFLHRLGLRQRSGKAVEQVACTAIGFGNPFPDQFHYDFIGYELPGIHDLFRLDAQRTARLDRCPQHVSG